MLTKMRMALFHAWYQPRPRDAVAAIRDWMPQRGVRGSPVWRIASAVTLCYRRHTAGMAQRHAARRRAMHRGKQPPRTEPIPASAAGADHVQAFVHGPAARCAPACRRSGRRRLPSRRRPRSPSPPPSRCSRSWRRRSRAARQAIHGGPARAQRHQRRWSPRRTAPAPALGDQLAELLGARAAARRASTSPRPPAPRSTGCWATIPSSIFGTLSAPTAGWCWSTRAGIAVGAGAVVDTAGFTASTLRMSDADAIAGRLRFAGRRRPAARSMAACWRAAATWC